MSLDKYERNMNIFRFPLTKRQEWSIYSGSNQ